MRWAFLVLFCLWACQGAAAEKGGSVPSLPTGSVRFDTARGPWVVKVEIAADDASRTRGLMFRKSLEADHGMIFIFPKADKYAFWMHNTPLSLDLIFLDDNRAVVGVVANAPPENDAPRSVGKPSRYVIEVSAGESAAHGVGPGTRVAFIDIAE